MERLAQIAGAIFDLDGTLLDSMWVWQEVDRRFLARRGIAVPDDYMAAVNALEFSAAARYTIDRFALDETPQHLMDEWMELSRQAYAAEVALKPHAGDYLRTLARRGVPLGVATSAAPELFIPALRRCGVYGLFAAFTTTREVGRGKQFPDVYLETAKKLGLPASRCAVFEDTLLGIRGAKRGGFLTVGILEPCSAHEADDIRREADITAASFAELLPQPV